MEAAGPERVGCREGRLGQLIADGHALDDQRLARRLRGGVGRAHGVVVRRRGVLGRARGVAGVVPGLRGQDPGSLGEQPLGQMVADEAGGAGEAFGGGDGVHRWMGSIAQDKLGNIAVSYSASGSAVYPSMRMASRATTGAWPYSAARISGVRPCPSVASRSARAAMAATNHPIKPQ